MTKTTKKATPEPVAVGLTALDRALDVRDRLRAAKRRGDRQAVESLTDLLERIALSLRVPEREALRSDR